VEILARGRFLCLPDQIGPSTAAPAAPCVMWSEAPRQIDTRAVAAACRDLAMARAAGKVVIDYHKPGTGEFLRRKTRYRGIMPL
jgi:hypothetical protein